MGRMTVGEILDLIEDEIEPKKFLNKISNNFRDKTNRFNVKNAKNNVLFEMDEDEAQQSMDGIEKWLKSDKRNGDFDDGDKPNIDYWWFGLPDPPLDESWDDDDDDDDDYGDSYLDRYEGGRRRRRKRTRRKRGGESCDDDDDCDEYTNETHTGICTEDNDGKGVCTTIANNQGGRRRRKRTRRKKKSKRRRRKRKRTKKKRRRRRRK